MRARPVYEMMSVPDAGLGFFTAEEFVQWVRPEKMIKPTPRT